MRTSHRLCESDEKAMSNLQMAAYWGKRSVEAMKNDKKASKMQKMQYELRGDEISAVWKREEGRRD